MASCIVYGVRVMANTPSLQRVLYTLAPLKNLAVDYGGGERTRTGNSERLRKSSRRWICVLSWCVGCIADITIALLLLAHPEQYAQCMLTRSTNGCWLKYLMQVWVCSMFWTTVFWLNTYFCLPSCAVVCVWIGIWSIPSIDDYKIKYWPILKNVEDTMSVSIRNLLVKL